MKQQSVIEGNRVINEFAPEITKNLFEEEMYYIPDHIEFIPVLKYHSSWDWLKPVVDKIFEYSLAYPEQTKWVCSAKIVVEIIPCWMNVIKFIRWYNTHNPSTPKP